MYIIGRKAYKLYDLFYIAMMKTIPRLMCTQHPDMTVKITAEGGEVDEALVAYAVYGCDEVMVDYEGKSTPYSQPKEIIMKAHEVGIALGERLFITPRLPNPKLEDLDRAMLAMETSVIANYFSIKYMGDAGGSLGCTTHGRGYTDNVISPKDALPQD